MKLFASLAIAASLLVAALSAEANIYKPGTKPYNMINALEKFIPANAEIIFVLENDRHRFMADLNQSAIAAKPALRAMVDEAVRHTRTLDAGIYAVTKRSGKSVNDVSLCTIFAEGEQHLDLAFMHEIMHCIAFSNTERYDMAKSINVVMNDAFVGQNSEAVRKDVKNVVLMESNAILLSYAIMSNHGVSYDKPYVDFILSREYPVNPAPNSLKRGVEICNSVSCPSDASDLMDLLMNDAKFVESLKKDFSTVLAYAAKK